ncbi:MAG: hypothetical protein M1820_009429 [Bogoriella megaspora]|nr:MAG: hypothetical protein M1820_009429 [Bogoriella megaspora]
MSALETTPKGAVSPRSSGVPLLQRQSSDTPKQSIVETPVDEDSSPAPKAGKRSLFGLGKKKKDERATRKDGQDSKTGSPQSAGTPPVTAIPLSSSMPSASTMVRSSESPHRPRHNIQIATSPHRRVRSTSPRLHSPADSQIFERDVQETASLAGDLSPSLPSHIPSHIATENHIPPVLEASSLAITDDQLDPDNVEILTHSIHQPAGLTVTTAGSEIAGSPPSQDDLPSQITASHHESADDGASNYGAFDNSDPRRLSFISFADVVQAEHIGGSRDSIHLMSQSSTAPSMSANRSPSPVRSPVSGSSPPTSGAASFKGLESSPSRGTGIRAAGSPTSASSPPFGGELIVETMRQALHKTTDPDIAGSKPLSAVSSDDATASERHPFR